jgi:hypothetical protein
MPLPLLLAGVFNKLHFVEAESTIHILTEQHLTASACPADQYSSILRQFGQQRVDKL